MSQIAGCWKYVKNIQPVFYIQLMDENYDDDYSYVTVQIQQSLINILHILHHQYNVTEYLKLKKEMHENIFKWSVIYLTSISNFSNYLLHWFLKSIKPQNPLFFNNSLATSLNREVNL